MKSVIFDISGMKLGEPFVYDPKFNGPRLERSSTDTICLVVFATAVGIWMAVGFWGEIFKHGHFWLEPRWQKCQLSHIYVTYTRPIRGTFALVSSHRRQWFYQKSVKRHLWCKCGGNSIKFWLIYSKPRNVSLHPRNNFLLFHVSNVQTKGQPIRDESDAVELVKYFKALMLPVFVGQLLVMAGAIGLVFTMRWFAAAVTWAIIGAFHAFLLLGQWATWHFEFTEIGRL